MASYGHYDDSRGSVAHADRHLCEHEPSHSQPSNWYSYPDSHWPVIDADRPTHEHQPRHHQPSGSSIARREEQAEPDRHGQGGRADLYRYRPISKDRTVRIIELRPSKNKQAQIAFKLKEISIDNPRPYEALSYTWDGQACDRPVRCGGKLLYITLNAEAALRRLRLRDEARYIWIDAICINQASIAEKNIQVAMMAEIYGRATLVVVWLGEGSPWLRSGLDFLRRKYSRPMGGDNVSLWSRLLRTSSTIVSHLHYMISDLGADSLLLPPIQSMGCQELLRHRYWTRIWTVQEMALARDAVIYAGKAKPLCLSSTVLTPSIITEQANKNYSIDRTIEGTLMQHFTSAGSRGISTERKYSLIRETLVEKQASNPLDLVFALRALYPEILGSVNVDYSRSIGDVYAEASALIMAGERSLDVLLYASYGPKAEGLPSWVPDWSVFEFLGENRPGFERPAGLSPGKRPAPRVQGGLTRSRDPVAFRFSNQMRSFHVRGSSALVIEFATETFPDLTKQRLRRSYSIINANLCEILRRFLHRCEEPHVDGDGNQPPEIWILRDSNLYHILQAHAFFKGSRAELESCLAKLRNERHSEISQSHIKFDDDDVQELDEALGCVAEGSRMIVTQKIGRSAGQYTHAAKAWAPHSQHTRASASRYPYGRLVGFCAKARPGDELVCLQGLRYPLFILRPQTRVNGNRSYHLVGILSVGNFGHLGLGYDDDLAAYIPRKYPVEYEIN